MNRKKIKIVYYRHTMANPGGVERIFTEKMNYLAEIYGYNVYLIIQYQGYHPMYYKISPKVNVIDLDIRYHKKYDSPIYKRPYLSYKDKKKLTYKFQKAIAQINPDIICMTASASNLFIFDISTNAKIIMESHEAKYHTNHDFAWYHRGQFLKNIKTRIALQKIERKSNVIVTLTEEDAKHWKTSNVVVIPNIVDIHSTCHNKNTNRMALFVGRFVYQKGLDRLLNAWKIVVSNRKDWTLKLVGEGELKEQLINQCKELGIDNNVIFAPATKNVVSEYTESSIFLLSSRHEGFGLVLVEAMQCGLPCVSFDCPYGPADIIDDGKNGYLVEDGNIEAFANCVLKLIENDSLRKDMGAAAIEKSKQYLPEKIMPQWMDLFEKLTAKI